ncbi:MAG TPA: hypothetical protein VG797_11040 [Phycisphaerales bacterium]|nr:hypothetical protein [Phycisphaerales bacterium]
MALDMETNVERTRGMTIGYAPMPAYDRGIVPYWMLVGLTLLVAIVIGYRDPAALIAVVPPFGVSVIALIVAIVVDRARGAPLRRLYGPKSGEPPPAGVPDRDAGWAIFTFLGQDYIGGWYFERGARWRRIRESLGDRVNVLPATIADTARRADLEDVPLLDDLIEPEFIVGSRGMSRFALVITLLLYALLTWGAMAQRQWFLAAFFGAFAIMMAVPMPVMKKRLTFLRYEGRAPIAGPGVVKDFRGRRWARGEAIMAVQRGQGPRALQVTMIGPMGLLSIPFANSSDPDFIALWQRWNHPHPRPELLTEA